MKFYGQKILINELKRIIIKINDGANFSVLLRAPSGYGKSLVLSIIIRELGYDNSVIYVPHSDITFIADKRFHFIDEVHTMKNIERLYCFMDSKKYSIFLATNLSGRLPEALKNRCIQLIFSDYSDSIIKEMLKDNLSNYNLSDEVLNALIPYTRNNPRIAKIISTRLSYMIEKDIKSKDELKEIMKKLGIDELGLTELDRKYLNLLKKLKYSSLQNIISSTGIDRETIIEEIEPFLLKKGIIKITSRGRELIKEV